MSSTREELESFQEFANKKLTSGQLNESLDELFTQWHDHRCRNEVNEAIRRGLSDVAAGRHAPVREAMEAIRKEFDFANE